MKYVKHVLLFIILAFSMQVQARTLNEKVLNHSILVSKSCFYKMEQNNNQVVTNAFRRAVTHYPYEVKLLQNAAIKQRLIRLIGQKNYNLLLTYHLQNEVSYAEGYYHCWFAQPHAAGNCFEIYYHTGGNFTVFLDKDGTSRYWQERKDEYILYKHYNN